MDIVITAEAVQVIGWFYAATSVLRVSDMLMMSTWSAVSPSAFGSRA